VERNRPDIDPNVLARWQEFLKHPSIASISNRDAGSKRWLEEHLSIDTHITSHPDLVCALPLPPVRRESSAPIVGIVTRHIKSAREYALLPEIASMLCDNGWRVRHIIGGVRGHGKKDFENSKLVEIEGKEVVYSEDLDDITRAIGECNLLLSMKLHTTIVGVMYGVPTVCMNPAVKAREFMKIAGLEDLVFGSLDRNLLDLISEGVRAPDPVRVAKLREEAVVALKRIGQQIWDQYR